MFKIKAASIRLQKAQRNLNSQLQPKAMGAVL